MNRAKQRRLIALGMLVLGLVMVSISLPNWRSYPNYQWLALGAFFVVFGALGLLGVNVFKGGRWDPRWDSGWSPTPELMRVDRLAEDPTRPNQRWLPLDFVAFPYRCVACQRPPVGSWRLRLLRGFDLLIVAVLHVNFVDAPICGFHRRQRRLGSFLLWAAILSPLGALALIHYTVGDDYITTPVIMTIVGLFALFIGFYRSLGSQLVDRAVLGVSGGRLDKEGRSGFVYFRDRDLAEQVAALTRTRMLQPGVRKGPPKLPTGLSSC